MICLILAPTQLRKHAYSNILKTSPPKTKTFQIKILMFFIFLRKNIGCGYLSAPPRRGGSYDYPQSMFSSRNKKNNVNHCKHQFYYIKVGLRAQNYIGMFFGNGLILSISMCIQMLSKYPTWLITCADFRIFTLLLAMALPHSIKSGFCQVYWLNNVRISQCAKTCQNILNGSSIKYII